MGVAVLRGCTHLIALSHSMHKLTCACVHVLPLIYEDNNELLYTCVTVI